MKYWCTHLPFSLSKDKFKKKVIFDKKSIFFDKKLQTMIRGIPNLELGELTYGENKYLETHSNFFIVIILSNI